MRVEILAECGYESALKGLALSYNSKPSHTVAHNLCRKGGGHNKFLESMVVWLSIEAPRYWWQQFDTYRVGITKQSESTMHTLLRSPLTQENFEGGCEEVMLKMLNDKVREKDFYWVKRHLPESFLQTRVVCMNYKSIQNMYNQRKEHKLEEWQFFLDKLLDLIEHPEFI